MTPEQLKQLYLEPDHVLKPNDYENAMFSQGACNSSGLIFSLARVMEKICEEMTARGQGGVFKNSHPILRLYLEQIASLCGKDIDQGESGGLWFNEHEKTGMSYSTAYDICRAKIKEGKIQ
jgi:hypothetical protein